MRTRKTTVILISGKAESGKSTTAELLESKLKGKEGLDVVRYSFANPIKYIAQAFGGWNKEKDPKGRRFLQSIGKSFREYDINIWVKHFLNQMDKHKGPIPVNFYLIDDWRFPDEYSYLKSNPLLDVLAVRITGRGGLSGDEAADSSENSLPEPIDEYYGNGKGDAYGYDFVIENSGDIELLSSKIDIVLSVLEKQYIVE